MCRKIRPLFNFDPPATDEEIRAAALRFVRKISGFHKPSKANEAPFQAAVDDIGPSPHNVSTGDSFPGWRAQSIPQCRA